MDKRVCTVCKTEKTIDNFYKTGKRNGNQRYTYLCKLCRKPYSQKVFINNREAYKKRNTKHRLRAVAIYNEYKENLFCTDCNMSFKNKAYLCDFHHLDKENKKKVANLKSSRRQFEIEIKKCIPLCANCHRIRHHS